MDSTKYTSCRIWCGAAVKSVILRAYTYNWNSDVNIQEYPHNIISSDTHPTDSRQFICSLVIICLSHVPPTWCKMSCGNMKNLLVIFQHDNHAFLCRLSEHTVFCLWLCSWDTRCGVCYTVFDAVRLKSKRFSLTLTWKSAETEDFIGSWCHF